MAAVHYQNTKKTEKTILLVDGDSTERSFVEITLTKNRYNLFMADCIDSSLKILGTHPVDLIVSEYQLSDGNALDLHARSRQHPGRPELIILTSDASIRSAVTAIKQGACDYIIKSPDHDELLEAVRRVFESETDDRENVSAFEEIAWKYSFDNIIGVSHAARKMRELASRVAPTGISVLITGEPGSGKEFLAKTIHYHSKQRKNRLISILCSNPANDSTAPRKNPFKGLLDNPSGGTIFLDDIDGASPALQAELLHFLQNAGDKSDDHSTSRKIDFRIIAAATEDLVELAEEGRFKKELLYRLSVVPIYIPPLKNRIEDMPLLVEYFLKMEDACRTGDKLSISNEAMQLLLARNWPGNIRELETLIKRAAAVCKNGQIGADEISSMSPDQMTLSLPLSDSPQDIDSGTLEESLKERIRTALYNNNWNLTRTATRLGIGRTTLWRKIKRYKIVRKGETADQTVHSLP